MYSFAEGQADISPDDERGSVCTEDAMCAQTLATHQKPDRIGGCSLGCHLYTTHNICIALNLIRFLYLEVLTLEQWLSTVLSFII